MYNIKEVAELISGKIVGNENLIFKRLAPFTHSPWISLPLNIAYRKYADKYEHFTREVMCDNSDIPIVND